MTAVTKAGPKPGARSVIWCPKHVTEPQHLGHLALLLDQKWNNKDTSTKQLGKKKLSWNPKFPKVENKMYCIAKVSEVIGR